MTQAIRMNFGRVLVLLGLTCPAVLGEVQVLGVHYRADKPFPQYRGFWHEDSNLPEDTSRGGAEELTAREPLGASLHVLVKNAGANPLTLTDVTFAGESLTKALAFSDQRKERKPASIYYANLPKDRLDKLIAAGEPIWLKIDPRTIAPGGTGQVVVRLRHEPQARTAPLVLHDAGGTTPVDVPVMPEQARLAGVYFSKDLTQAYLYFRHSTRGKMPRRVLLDGRDVTSAVTFANDAAVEIVPGLLKLEQGLAPMSFHVFQGVYDDGQIASAGLRAWCDEFAYGMFGGPGGKEENETLAKQYFTELANHNINIQMPQVGSEAVASFMKSPAGHPFVADLGIRFVNEVPGKWGVTNPFLVWIKDEPDCADPKMTGVPPNKMVGLLAQWCLRHTDELREQSPDFMSLINLDSTNKPHNWYVYGQTPDVLSVDPYYPPRLRMATWEHPNRMRLYAKATYVRIVSEIAQSACEPNPLHVIMHSCSLIDIKDNQPRVFPFPTSECKRIEAYYAVGSGAKGLSYWWFTPNPKPRADKRSVANGVGAGMIHGDPAANRLWREIGLLGAEFRTLGPLLVHSCPAPLDIQAPEGLLIRSLVVGLDTIIVLVVNDQYTNSINGTNYQPIAKASLGVDLPAWLTSPQAFEINALGPQTLKAAAQGGRLTLDLGKVDLTRLIVITSNPKLRSQLQKRYDTLFREKVANLMAAGGKEMTKKKN